MGCDPGKTLRPTNNSDSDLPNRLARVSTANDFLPTRRQEEAVENLENVTLIWLDQFIDETNEDCKKSLLLLRQINDFLLTFTDSEPCIKYIKSVGKESVLLIVSGSLSKDMLPQVASLPQLDSVFIFCSNSSSYEHLKHDYPTKVVDIFTEQESLMKSIRQQLSLISKQTMAFSFFNQKQKSSRDITKEAASFLWFQFLFNVLKEFPQTKDSKNEMLAKCEEYYRGNPTELQIIEHFRRTYEAKDAIAWYTETSFVYRLLNKALRTEDIDGLYLFRFFIIDLCKQLKEESQKNAGIMILYRGQVMTEEELDKLSHSVGSLISTNGFFSTSLVKQVATDFLQHAKSKRNELKQVLFEITADSTVKSIVFADIEWLSLKKEEHEVLFSIGAVFKIERVTFSDEMCCWLVRMAVTDEGMKDVQEYIDFTMKGYEDMDISLIFGRLLIDMNELTKADKYFNLLMATTENDSLLKADILVQSGHVSMTRSQHSAALQCYSRAYDIRKNHLHSNHPKIGSSLRNMGSVSYETRDYEKAIDYFKRFLNIYHENYGNIDDMSIAKTLQMLAKCDRRKGDLNSALDFCTQALEMKQRLLPKEHCLIADTLSNTGLVYDDQKDYDKALEYYFDALKMCEKTLPAGHRCMLNLFRGIVKAYTGKGDYSLLPYVGDLQAENENFQLALDSYYKQLDIGRKIYLLDNPRIAVALRNIGVTQFKLKNYDDAMKYLEEAREIFQSKYSSDHEEVKGTLKGINEVEKAQKTI